MTTDPQGLMRAIRELRYFAPLDEQDPRYVDRGDRLGQRIANRVLAPSAPTVLLAGPTGCGKSTELLRMHHAIDRHLVVYTRCDQDLDPAHLDAPMLLRYLTWAVLDAVSEQTTAHAIDLPEGILREALACLYAYDPREWGLPWRAFADRGFSASQETADLWVPRRERTLPERRDALSHLLLEVHRIHRPVLLLVDGLEKLPSPLARALVLDLVRSGVLAACQSVIVVPHGTLFGWEAFHGADNVDVFSVEVEHKPEFARAVLARRAAGVVDDDALDLMASYAGGVLRDGLQLATLACRAALDARDPRVTLYHANGALRVGSRTIRDVLSDDPERAERFLRHVHQSRSLPGDPEMRDRLVALGAVLQRPNGGFRVHPAFELAFHLTRAQDPSRD